MIARKQFVRVALALATLAMIGFALAALAAQWDQVRAAAATVRPDWGITLLSCAVVLVTYALLIDVWRRLAAAWGPLLPMTTAAHIWTVSNLGRYVPGKVWQISSMALMAQRRGISPGGAVAAALLSTIIFTLSGFGVTLVFGAGVVEITVLATISIALLALGMLLLPDLLPWGSRLAARMTGRDMPLFALSRRTVWLTFGAATLAWCLYGVAFELFVRAMTGDAPGSTGLYIAVFAGSYLAGFLAIFSPGGIVVREAVMAVMLERAGFDAGSAILIAMTSRVWLTVLEIFPAVIFLAFSARRREAES